MVGWQRSAASDETIDNQSDWHGFDVAPRLPDLRRFLTEALAALPPETADDAA